MRDRRPFVVRDPGLLFAVARSFIGDPNRFGLEVNIAPTQGSQFTDAQTEVGERDNDVGQPMKLVMLAAMLDHPHQFLRPVTIGIRPLRLN